VSTESIQQRREGLGLSREGLADRAQVTLRTIERIEAGEVTPQRSTLRVIDLALEAAAEEASTAEAA
jgi:predicted transcriptional regulator